MPIDLITRIPDDSTPDMIGQMIAQDVEAAVVFNTLWYLASWDLGEDPKCCPACAGVKYVPQPAGSSWAVDVAPVLLAKGFASCESAAAMHTAHKRADGFRNLTTTRPLIDALQTPEGRRAWEIVKQAYTIKLEPSGMGDTYWHVVSYDEGERHDATEEMQR